MVRQLQQTISWHDDGAVRVGAAPGAEGTRAPACNLKSKEGTPLAKTVFFLLCFGCAWPVSGLLLVALLRAILLGKYSKHSMNGGLLGPGFPGSSPFMPLHGAFLGNNALLLKLQTGEGSMQRCGVVRSWL